MATVDFIYIYVIVVIVCFLATIKTFYQEREYNLIDKKDLFFIALFSLSIFPIIFFHLFRFTVLILSLIERLIFKK